MTLLLAQPEDYRYIYPEIITSYESDPEAFATTFFDLLPQIDPKVVRLIGYQLYTNGFDFGRLYKIREVEKKPEFLFNLSTFPFESMIVLLKYGFPEVIDGDLFLLPSIDQTGSDNWFEFYLNFGININHINQSTGESLLHHFVRSGQLPEVELLLCHGAIPTLINRKGQDPLRIAVDEMNERHLVYLQIIRQLARYGARPREEDRKVIESSPDRIKITQEIQTGATMTPHHCKKLEGYFSFDLIEDLNLISQVNPELIDDKNFRELIPRTNFPILADGIEQVRDQTIKIGKVIVGWPYYIDIGWTKLCPLVDDEVTAASPPTPKEVYELALQGLPDNHGEEPSPMTTPPVPPMPHPTKWTSATYYVPLVSIPTFPLPEQALRPTGAPPLPSM